MTDIDEHDVYVLTDDQIDIIDHAMRRTYMFDGYAGLVRDAGEAEAQKVAETFRALGFNDVYDPDDAMFECDGCGRIGTVDDGISGDGDECPDEDCDGTVHRLTEES